MDLKGRDFLKLLDYSPEEIQYLVDLAARLKEKKKKGIAHDQLRGRHVALIFEKTSTRTRCSFEVAAGDLGMGSTYLDPSSSQIGKKAVKEFKAGIPAWKIPFLELNMARNAFLTRMRYEYADKNDFLSHKV